MTIRMTMVPDMKTAAVELGPYGKKIRVHSATRPRANEKGRE